MTTTKTTETAKETVDRLLAAHARSYLLLVAKHAIRHKVHDFEDYTMWCYERIIEKLRQRPTKSVEGMIRSWIWRHSVPEYFRANPSFAQPAISMEHLVSGDNMFDLFGINKRLTYPAHNSTGFRYYSTEEMAEADFKPYWLLPDPIIWCSGLDGNLSLKAQLLLEACRHHRTTKHTALVELLSHRKGWSLRSVERHWAEIKETYNRIHGLD